MWERPCFSLWYSWDVTLQAKNLPHSHGFGVLHSSAHGNSWFFESGRWMQRLKPITTDLPTLDLSLSLWLHIYIYIHKIHTEYFCQSSKNTEVFTCSCRRHNQHNHSKRTTFMHHIPTWMWILVGKRAIPIGQPSYIYIYMFTYMEHPNYVDYIQYINCWFYIKYIRGFFITS